MDDLKSGIDLYKLRKLHPHETERAQARLPVLVALANAKQCAKMVQLLNYCIESKVSYSLLMDESDETWIKTESKLRDAMADSHCAHIAFFTATPGRLLDFPEVANARILRFQSHESATYVGYLNADIQLEPRQKNNSAFARKVITTRLDTFMRPFTRDELTYHHVLLVNGGSSVASHLDDATHFVSLGFNVIVDDEESMKVHRDGMAIHTEKSHRRPKNEILFHLYQSLQLQSKPLIILANRKLTRGHTYHFAPPDGSFGFLVTDMIFQLKASKSSADTRARLVQLAGRPNGHIRQCINYFGITYYTTADVHQVVQTDTQEIVEFNQDAHHHQSTSVALTEARAMVATRQQTHAHQPQTVNDSEVEYPDSGCVRVLDDWIRYQVLDTFDEAVHWVQTHLKPGKSTLTLRGASPNTYMVPAMFAKNLHLRVEDGKTIEELTLHRLHQLHFVGLETQEEQRIRRWPILRHGKRQWVIYWRPRQFPNEEYKV
jgi:hypothetical protein